VPVDLPIRCSCGAVRGVASGVSAAAGNRLVCYCDDCQSFPHFLGQADRVLDAHGGTDIFQTSPAHLRFTEGTDRLACMRLRPRGLLRWYAGCCRTPIGNTPPTRGLPFVGLIHTCVDHVSDGRSRDETLGPIRARAHGRFAKGERAGLDAHDKAPASLILRFLRILVMARLRGDQARSPFFDASGAPIVAPHVLGEDEFRRVEAARDAS
jgi:hypothetical protein